MKMACVCFVALGMLATGKIEGAEMDSSWTPELMIQVKRVGSVQVSPDGGRAVFAVRRAVMEGEVSEYRTQLHLMDTVSQQSRPLTQGDKSCDEPQWSPDGKWIALISNRTGKKNLWVISPDGGEAIQLTEFKSDVISFQWAPHGRAIAFVALDPMSADAEQRVREKNDARVVDENVRKNRLSLITITDPPTLQREPRFLTSDSINVVADSSRPGRASYDWSPDGKTIVFAHSRSPAADDWQTADISMLDVGRGTIRSLVSSAAAETSPLFSLDGQSIAFAASGNPPTWAGARTMQIVSVNGGTPRKLPETADGFGRYSEIVGWSADGTKLYYTEVRGTVFKLMQMPLDGSPQEIAGGQTGEIGQAGMSLSGVSLNAKRTHFGFAWETLQHRAEAVVCEVASLKPVMQSQVNSADPMPLLGVTKLVRWKSTERFEVEGLLTYPVGYVEGMRYPLLLVIHGGPMGVFTQTYDGTPNQYPVAAFASRGYAVLRPNPRGSSGYGRKFRYANYGDWGGGDFRDIMSGVDHVIASGVADPDRLGVMGWSYGGFMTSWTITQTKRFKAASVGAGVTNLVSFTGTADIPSFLPDYFAGEFWDKLDAYRTHSAMFHVKGVTTPTLIQHGDKDERVPLSQGQELYNALKRQGCVTRMIVYPRTPHGIEEPRLLLDCMNRNLEWFDQYLGLRKQTAGQ